MNQAPVNVSVRNKSALVRLNGARIKSLCRFVLKAEKAQTGEDGATVNVMFTDDAFITDMNRRYLDHDRPTDVISFPGAPEDFPAHGRQRHIGDICISLETALRQHKIWNTTLQEEIALYVIHGLLHLLGYTDVRPADYRRMQDRQNAILMSIIHSPRHRAILDLTD